MTRKESTYDDVSKTAFLSSGEIINGFHKSIHCKGDVCPVHKPSEHELRDMPLSFDFGRFIFERIVTLKDGTERRIPDPDDFTLNQNDGDFIYRNSIRCNKCGDDIVSSYTHDFVECSCKAVFVDGGSSYRRIGGKPEDYTDTAILLEKWKFKYMEAETK